MSDGHQTERPSHLSEVLQEGQPVTILLELLVLSKGAGENQGNKQQTMIESEDAVGPVGSMP